MRILNGHYIERSYCIKCDTQHYRWDDSLEIFFSSPCRGRWKTQIATVKIIISDAEKELRTLRKWAQVDARSSPATKRGRLASRSHPAMKTRRNEA